MNGEEMTDEKFESVRMNGDGKDDKDDKNDKDDKDDKDDKGMSRKVIKGGI